MDEPTVSVCIVTYQHGRFLAQAIEGALQQKTNFAVEILVGDDGSTDGASQICLDYARRHPDRIRGFVRDRKDVILVDGRPRGFNNFQLTLRAARGEFIALCEGDDFWTDPRKLQRQVDYLRRNPECVGCFHDAVLVDPDGFTTAASYFQSAQEKFTQQDVIESLLSRQPTCSMVFRRAAYEDPLPAWYLRRPSDLYLDILLTQHGPLGFIRENMAAYRIHSGGMWSGQREAGRIVELIVRYKLLLADPYFLEQYRELLLRKVDEFEDLLFTRSDSAEAVARLEKTAQDQMAVLALTQTECRRLEGRERDVLGELAQARTDAQGHIDALRAQLAQQDRRSEETIQSLRQQLDQTVARSEATLATLKAQLDQLAAILRDQTAHLTVLERERDRLTAENEHARDEARRAHTSAQSHIDQLRSQLDTTVGQYESLLGPLRQQLEQLAATSREQTQHISTLEREVRRLTGEAQHARGETAEARAVAQKHVDALLQQLTDLAATSREQTQHISTLEREVRRLTGEAQHARDEAAGARAGAQQHVDRLLKQLTELAASSREQAAHIAVLEREQDRLTAHVSELTTASEHYVKVMAEQLAYIRILEAMRDQAIGTRPATS